MNAVICQKRLVSKKILRKLTLTFGMDFLFLQCPQCGRNYLARQIINLYAPEIAVANNDLERVIPFFFVY